MNMSKKESVTNTDALQELVSPEPEQKEIAHFSFSDPALVDFLKSLPPSLFHLSLKSPQEIRSYLRQGRKGVYVMNRVTKDMLQAAAFAKGWNDRTSLRRKSTSSVYMYEIMDPKVSATSVGNAGTPDDPEKIVGWYTLKKQPKKLGHYPRIHVQPLAVVDRIYTTELIEMQRSMRKLLKFFIDEKK